MRIYIAATLLLASCGFTQSIEQRFLSAIQSGDLTTAQSMQCVTTSDLAVTAIDNYELGSSTQEERAGYEVQLTPVTIDGAEYDLLAWDTDTFADFAIAQQKAAANAGVDIPAPSADELRKGGRCVALNPKL